MVSRDDAADGDGDAHDLSWNSLDDYIDATG